MKTNFKKLTAVILAVMTVLSCCVAGFATIAWQDPAESNNYSKVLNYDTNKELYVTRDGNKLVFTANGANLKDFKNSNNTIQISPASGEEQTWNNDDTKTTFGSLSYGQQYVVKATYNGTTYEFSIKIKYSRNSEPQPVYPTIYADAINIEYKSGFENCEIQVVKSSDTFNEADTWTKFTKDRDITKTDLTPDTAYKIYIRYSENDTYYASDYTVCEFKTKKVSNATKPSEPVAVSVGVNKITVADKSGDGNSYEYGIKTTNDTAIKWQDELVFTGLKADTPYNLYCRIKATDDMDASEVSNALAVRTTTRNPLLAVVDDGTFKIHKNGDEDEVSRVGRETAVIAKTINPSAAWINVNGDTKLVAKYVKVEAEGINIAFSTGDNEGKATYTPNQQGKQSYTVTYIEYIYENGWKETGNVCTRTYTATVKTKLPLIAEIFVMIFNFLLDTLPAKLLEIWNALTSNGDISGIISDIGSYFFGSAAK